MADFGCFFVSKEGPLSFLKVTGTVQLTDTSGSFYTPLQRRRRANATMSMIRFLFKYVFKHLFLLLLILPYAQVDYREGLFYSTIMSIELLFLEREPTDISS